MIHATELRIGNYTLDSIKKINHKVSGNTIHCLEFSVSDVLKPIPLTEEWLLKFGFEKNSMKSHLVIKGYRIWICRDLFLCDKNGITLKHVHQLQNLYFALTGEELEIK